MKSFLGSVALVSFLSIGAVMTAIACSNTPPDEKPDAADASDASDASDANADGDADASLRTITLPDPLTGFEIKYGGGMPQGCIDAGVPGTDLTIVFLHLDTKKLERTARHACKAAIDHDEVSLSDAQITEIVKRARALPLVAPDPGCMVDGPTMTVVGFDSKGLAGLPYYTKDSESVCRFDAVLDSAATRALYNDLLAIDRDAAAP